MFLHKHPYPPFIPKNTTKLIVGTLPPPRFTTGELHKKDVDFCYGSYYNSLWQFIDVIFKLNLRFDNSKEAVTQRKIFLTRQNIGICDIVESCYRKKPDASDIGMQDIKLRNIIHYLQLTPTITTLLFIGGSSKNGPEHLFKKQLKKQGLQLKLEIKTSPKIHTFCLDNRIVKTVSLISSSGAANISIGSTEEFKKQKAKNPNYTPFDYRVAQYKRFL